jgi:hypothetical protein
MLRRYRLEMAEQLKSGKKAATAGTGRGQVSSFDKAVLLAEAAEAGAYTRPLLSST